ncbi:hypothetical protein [Arhodomonas sp. AD133]|uniref:hypothetical protein n=1 Tax=Arhodomonas sp. AD133 TaxID=3415009 RepID=UPI003EBCF244
MHGWEGKAFEDIEKLTRRRDPRRYPVGAVTSDGTREVVQWFRNYPELQQYLVRMEPQRWGLAGADLLALKPELERALTPLAVAGPVPAVRATYNEAVAGYFTLLWWGTLDDLLAGDDDWSARTLAAARAAAFTGEPRRERLLEWLKAQAASD